MLYALQSAFVGADVILTLRSFVHRLVQLARLPPRAHLTAACIPLAHTFPSASSGRYLPAVQSPIAPWRSSGVRTPTKTWIRKRLGGSPALLLLGVRRVPWLGRRGAGSGEAQLSIAIHFIFAGCGAHRLPRTLLANRHERGADATHWSLASRCAHLDEACAGDGGGEGTRMRDAARVVDVGHGVDSAHPDSRALRMGMEMEPPRAYASAPGIEVEARKRRRADAHLGMQMTDPEEMEVEVERATELDSLDGEAGDAGLSPSSSVGLRVRKCAGRGGGYPARLPRLRVRKTRIQTGCPSHDPCTRALSERRYTATDGGDGGATRVSDFSFSSV
ncbi:hypothetical protein B0H13DRAFT_1894379 [Mycena leptocephala]|nr:hypothetical protein B0H13DRAFT_1894379 [Mycena leptocephala]